MSRIMAIDYGAKRSGIAVTDSENIIATPLGFCLSKDIFTYLERYFENEEVVTLVVGYPTKSDGTKTQGSYWVDIFLKKLKKRFPKKKVFLQDEYNTSKDALQSMVANNTKKKKEVKKGL